MYFLMTFLVNKEYFAKNVSALKENPFHVIDFNHVFTTLFDTFKILYTKSVTYVPSYVPYDP